ncbi:hypothetical protein DXC61_15385 [Segatella copri]|uniref:Uncharacterized protein n=1 Tax=Segatella copri TaxID=165179 RepID=A0AA92SVV2_9BACT|nr:hypothetical protein DXC61_15385 [Segatella copri]
MLSIRIPNTCIKMFSARSTKATQIKQHIFFYTVKIQVSQQTTINTFFIWYKIIIFRIFVSEAMNGLVATFYNHSIINIVNLMLYHKA